MDNIIERILNTEDLPSPPGVAAKLLEIFDDPDACLDDIAKVISADPALTAKIIDYCNSPLMGRPRKTTSLQQSVVVLGLKAVKMIALSFSLVQTVPSEQVSFNYDAFWHQSLATAIAAKLLFPGKSSDDAFLVGLMLNIGVMAMAHVFEDEYLELVVRASDQNLMSTNLALAEIEREKWGHDHYEVGAALLEKWNFPKNVSDTLAGFLESLDDSSSNTFESIFDMADQLSSMMFGRQFTPQDLQRIKSNAEVFLQGDDQEFDSLFDSIVEEYSEYAKILSFPKLLVENVKELESKARKSMTQLSMGMHQENREIVQENSQLKQQVSLDELTGLKNRRAYESEGDAELQRSRRMNLPLTLMVIDIDHFKSINDEYGHDAGDKVLVSVAHCLSNVVRPYDQVFRFGGEEFVVMLADCDLKSASNAAERLRKTTEEMVIPYMDQVIKVTISIGVACVTPKTMCSLRNLFKVADDLLYVAKREGRNRCRVGQAGIVPITTEYLNDTALFNPNSPTG